MTQVAIVYHSGYGHTKVQAEHVAKGVASVDGVQARLVNVEDIKDNIDSLNDADGIIFGAPTYMASLSAPFKAFMDASSGVWFGQKWKDKVAGGFTNSGSLSGDKFNSLMQLAAFAAQHSMIWVSLGVQNETSAADVVSGDPSKLNRMGSYLGAMAQSDNLPAEQTPPSGDLRTAEALGKRVAEFAKKLKA